MKSLKSFQDLQSAVQFITILPAGTGHGFNPMGMIRFFPLVGIIVGLGLALVDAVASFLWPDSVSAVFGVLYLVVVTGAFHLDGLGDTADGIFSHRSKERALEIMKDSRSGMMGLVAVFMVLALKTAGIYAVKTSVPYSEVLLYMVFIPGLSRGAMLFGIRFLPYGRPQGTGHDLFSEKLPLRAFGYSLIPVAGLLVFTANGWLVLLTFLLFTALTLWFYRSKLGVITGDMLGAMTEATEAVLFLTAGIQMI